jgi:transcription termination/antitermination protein NusG
MRARAVTAGAPPRDAADTRWCGLRHEKQTERGEALPTDAWYAVWLRSNYEHVVREQLLAKGFETFLPQVRTWSRRQGIAHAIRTPMFPGYLFVHDALDKGRYIDLLKVHGVVRVLEDGWTRLTPVPEGDIEALQQIAAADVLVFPCANLRRGARVRVLAGPLAGVEGMFVEDKPSKGRLVVSVDMLGRSIAVEMDGSDVEPCHAGQALERQHAGEDRGDRRC